MSNILMPIRARFPGILCSPLHPSYQREKIEREQEKERDRRRRYEEEEKKKRRFLCFQSFTPTYGYSYIHT